MIESGVPDYVVLTFIGVVAPAATPPAIVGKLNSAINASLRTPEVVKAAARLNAERRPASHRTLAAFLSPRSATNGPRWCGAPASRLNEKPLLRRRIASAKIAAGGVKNRRRTITWEAAMISRRALLASGAAFGAGIATSARAQSYPDKPIKMIVPFPPGGPIDTMARLTGKSMSASLGQQVIVENRPGAGSTIGFKAAAAADPDGYTLLFGSSGSLGVAPALYPSLDCRSAQAFRHGRHHVAAAAHHGGRPGRPGEDGRGVRRLRQGQPGQAQLRRRARHAAASALPLFKTQAGLDVTYIPYKGSAPSVTDLIGGQTHFTIDGMLILIPQVQAGKLRALAVGRAEALAGPCRTCRRSWRAAIPISPSTPGPASWRRRATPQIVARLNAVINDGLKTPEIKTALARFHALPKASTPQEFEAFLKDQLPKWASMVKLAGAKGE